MPSSQEDLVCMVIARIAYFLTAKGLEDLLEKYYTKMAEKSITPDSMDRVVVNMLEHMLTHNRKKEEEKS